MSSSSASNLPSNTMTSRIISALSWKEARTSLRKSLEGYLQTDIYSVQRYVSSGPSDMIPWIVSMWLKWDLDILLGAFGSSFALLIIGSVGLVKEASSTFTTSQLIGAVLILLGCLLNVWLLSRYRLSASQGTDSLKRRMISRFLKEIENQEYDCIGGPWDVDSNDNDPLSTTSRRHNFLHHDNGIDLVGTSLTAIYPVYRLHGKDDVMTGTTTSLGGYWSRIPTLLLVQGDHIALQVGDTVPATCRVLEGKNSSTLFTVGQTITLESLGESVNAVKLPRGRSTLPAESSELLTLCNRMRIFEVLETPLEGFLRQPDHDSKPPQVFRQLNDLRGILSLVAVGVFVMTAVILLSRYDQFTSNFYYLLPTPILAAMGGFPFIGPLCLIFIDALGTARILATYHPVASRVRSQQSAKEDNNETNVDLLILRYTLATLASRLSLQDLGGTLDRWVRGTWRRRQDREWAVSSLVHVPPASLNLLEKLGVATAFTLVDDELVCEPQAIPQQLLIPSGKGLKLLDLCPTYEDDSDDDSGDDSDSSMEFKRNRQRTGDSELNNLDSDSDSDDDLKDHHGVTSRRQPRRRLLRKAFRVSAQKPSKSTTEEENLESEAGDHEVQFEDPTWWQHLPSLKCIGLACLLVDQRDEGLGSSTFVNPLGGDLSNAQSQQVQLEGCKTSLVHLICNERRSMQLRSLAQCIGFSSKPSSSGSRGDVSPFDERHRLYVFSSARVEERLRIDSHERSSEESRWWGFLRADSTSVMVQDARSGAYQLLTVGDPRVVTRMCQEAWQGENSTILPLAAHDRETILETSDSWKLADLDVEAFSYAPIPHMFDTRIASEVNPKVSGSLGWIDLFCF
jgi:hypothetical protein